MVDVQVSRAAQGNPAGAGCGESDSGLEASPLVHPVYTLQFVDCHCRSSAYSGNCRPYIVQLMV